MLAQLGSVRFANARLRSFVVNGVVRLNLFPIIRHILGG
jgi:hypothetical protein